MQKSNQISIVNIITNKKFNLFIEYIFILPLLYLVQYNYDKYSIITLFISVFILIKNLLLMKITGLFKKEYLSNNPIPFVLIYKMAKMFIGIAFFFAQYKYKFAIEYNIWIANLFYLKCLIQFVSKKFSVNSIVKFKKQMIKHFNNLTN